MQPTSKVSRWLFIVMFLMATATPSAQTAAPSATQEDQMAMSSTGWQFMQDGVVFGTFSNQNGPRGSEEFRSQNWWMGMASRTFSSGSSLTLTSMASLEPATVRGGGYAELFQVGETYENLPLVDRQHPHDFFMQLSSAFRMPVGERAGLTIAGALVGDPALGPVAFMHRQSAAENPLAPLSHHTLDSTHVGMGVITAGVDVGPVALEGSVFQGAEPDENRWDLDLGALDSWSARLWYRPSGAWEFQVSHGYLTRPEAFEPQDIKRSTASMAWSRENGDDFTALTVAFGRNVRDFSTSNAVLAEITHRFSRNALYSRVEWVELETEHLLFPGFVHTPHPGELIDPLTVVTVGAVRDLADIRGFNVGVGGDVVLYAEPANLERTHGERPVAFHFVRPTQDSCQNGSDVGPHDGPADAWASEHDEFDAPLKGAARPSFPIHAHETDAQLADTDSTQSATPDAGIGPFARGKRKATPSPAQAEPLRHLLVPIPMQDLQHLAAKAG